MKLHIFRFGLVAAFSILVGSAHVRAADEVLKRTEVPLDRDVPRHRDINARAKQGNVDLIFIGDSITQGWEGNGAEVWKKRYEPRHAMNAGIGGDRTQHVLWRLDNGNVDNISPKLAVLMIGTNNFGDDPAEDIALGIKAIVAKLGTKLPKTKVLLLGVFPRDEKADDLLRAKTVYVNAIIKKLQDDKRVYFLDINPWLLKANGDQDRDLMPDLVHLSPRGYEIWGDAIESKVAELLEEPAPFPELPAIAGKIDKDAPSKFTTTDSGLKYRILRKGNGDAPQPTDRVTVHYKGWLDGGKGFDSSYDRNDPATFGLNQVIKGWTEGMQLVSTGGMIELEIPFALAYGENGRPPVIPPRATLHFLVELLGVN